MNQHRKTGYNKQLYYRLIALWVICEAFAGGIMHGIKIPFTGLIVSSLAITCIILIAYHVPSGSSIIKATIIVAIFKLLLSPHSPPTAYIAVLFQGAVGQLLFSSRRYFNIAAVILAVLGLVESAIQRILVLVIVYGNGLWKAINEFIQKLANVKEHTNYSLLIAIGYIALHALIGLFVGIYASRLARRSADWGQTYPLLLFDKENPVSNISPQKTQRNKKIKIVFLIIWLVLIALYIHGYLYPAHAIIPSNMIVNILARSVLVILGWYLLLSPLAMLIIQKILRSKQSRYKNEISEVMLLIPRTKYIFTQSYLLSGKKKGLQRIRLFLKILLINVLAD